MRIAHLIPRRNIETWVLCLHDRTVDEETDYRKDPAIDELVNPAGQKFFALSRPNASLPPKCVPSLNDAMPEIRRIE
jgi:hypothetical protein